MVPGVLRTTLIELLLAGGLFAAFFVFVSSDFLLDHLAALAMCSANLAIFWVWAQTRHTFKITSELLMLSSPEPGAVKVERAA